MLGGIQAQQLVQPALNLVARCIPACRQTTCVSYLVEGIIPLSVHRDTLTASRAASSQSCRQLRTCMGGQTQILGR